MDFSPELWGKAGLILGSVVAGIVLFFNRNIYHWSQPRFNFFGGALWVITRISTFIIFYLLLGWSVEGDVEAYYYNQGNSILQGEVIYRDFQSSYAPLFPYTIAFLLNLINSPKTIVFFSILVEGISLIFWMAVARQSFDETLVRKGIILYLTSPLVLMNVAFNGQNQIWISLFMALSAFYALRKKDMWSGLLYSGSIIFVKFLALLFTPCLFFLSRNHFKWAASFLILPVLVYGFCLYQNLDILTPFRAESLLTSAGNVPYLLTSILEMREGLVTDNPNLQLIFYAVLMSLLLGVMYLVMKNQVLRDPRKFPFLVTLFICLFMLFSNKSQTNYLITCFFPICLTVALPTLSFRKFAIFMLFSTVAILEPSFWYRTEFPSLHLLWDGKTDSALRLQMALFLFFEIILLGMYVFLSIDTFQKIFKKETNESSIALERI